MPRWLILTLAAVATSVIGTVIAKRWVVVPHQNFLFWLSMAFFILSSIAWIKVLKYERLTIVSIVWDVAYLIIVVVLGLAFYHERLNQQEWIGLALAIIAVILLTVKF